MTIPLLASIAAPLLLQSAPAAPPDDSAPTEAPLTSLDDLPIEQATGPRCGIAFALVSRWQRTGDERGAGYIDMESGGGREFFVRTMARLMDDTGLDRDQLATLANAEMLKLDTEEGAERVEAMMPACLLMKRSAGL
jgi:hypothetical protein